jgi:hypothetical protein
VVTRSLSAARQGGIHHQNEFNHITADASSSGMTAYSVRRAAERSPGERTVRCRGGIMESDTRLAVSLTRGFPEFRWVHREAGTLPPGAARRRRPSSAGGNSVRIGCRLRMIIMLFIETSRCDNVFIATIGDSGQPAGTKRDSCGRVAGPPIHRLAAGIIAPPVNPDDPGPGAFHMGIRRGRP